MTKTIPPTLLGCLTQPLSNDLASLFVKICLSNNDLKTSLFTKQMAKELGPGASILYNRISNNPSPFDLDAGLGMWISCLSDSPGIIVIWAWTLREMFIKHKRTLTLDDWTQEFPLGLPTEEEMSRVWGAQKTERRSNLLDEAATWVIPLT